LNLIANGLKFRKPEEPPLVRVSARWIADPHHAAGEDTAGQGGAGQAAAGNGAQAGASHCELTVSDNGIGFEQVYSDRIFELFQRLHGRNEYEGTGMGLAICRKIVERHGGSISARSTPGQGAEFVIILPLKQSEAGAA
jgi:signal transduction histidine kinase